MTKRLPVRRPFEQIQATVCNQSSRGSVIPRLIVVHSTESHNRPGKADLQSIVDWFDNSSAQASSHVIVDNEGISARCVADENKAWHCAGYNSVSLGIEQIGFASESKMDWLVNDRAQIKKVAKYIAFWAKKFGIPIQTGAVSNGIVTRPGVLRHMDLGMTGGGHNDPGAAYPFTALLTAAKYYKRAGWPH